MGLLTLAPALHAGGFAIPEQGSKAMALGGAFAAQADDPTALFYNVGGLAFFEEPDAALGMTLVTSTEESFVGAPPGIAAGTTGKLVSLKEPVPHLYLVRPMSPKWNFGLAINAPFGLKTEWENPDNFSGRYINTEASMLTIDVRPSLGIKLSETFGIGFGPIFRLSQLELNRRVPAVNPFTGSVVDVGAVRLESEMDEGLGWQVGLLHRPHERFSWGLAYHSKVTVKYTGLARFTQISTGNPLLDSLIATTIPFDQDLAAGTEIEFPDKVALGVAIGLGRGVLIEADVEWTGWSSFQTLRVAFPQNPAFDFQRPENWDDVYTYRFGLLTGRGSKNELRLGYLWDNSPQPAASVSPLLPDADRAGYSVGWGRKGGPFDIDLAVSYLDFNPRTTFISIDGFNGTYSQTGWLFAATFGI